MSVSIVKRQLASQLTQHQHQHQHQPKPTKRKSTATGTSTSTSTSTSNHPSKRTRVVVRERVLTPAVVAAQQAEAQRAAALALVTASTSSHTKKKTQKQQKKSSQQHTPLQHIIQQRKLKSVDYTEQNIKRIKQEKGSQYTKKAKQAMEKILSGDVDDASDSD